MTTHIDNLWIFALASKFTHENIVYSLLIMALLWLTMTFFYWSHPGGPAWGKYYYSNNNKNQNKNNNNNNLNSSSQIFIPGPKGYPLIGSMNLMSSSLAHQRIASTAKTCKATRLMAFSLGDTRAIVTCNPDVAKEILHSSVFADRPIKESAYSLMFNRAIGFAPYGVYWRTLRKISTNHLFSPMQIKSSGPQRTEIATQMIDLFRTRNRSSVCGFGVRDVLKRASLNNMMCSVFGQRFKIDEVNEKMMELGGLVEQGYDLLGSLNWGDHLPFLKDFDVQKIRFNCSELVPKVNRFVGSIISDHRADKNQTNKDFVHVLLNLQEPDKLSDSDMVAVLWEMIFRGTDTVAVLIEWILARLVLHPDVQRKVQKELDEVATGDARVFTEEDVAVTVYLPAVIKEVLRLHPPGPLLSWARLAITDTTIDGYHIPVGTTAMVNMWAIARDPNVWRDPLEFNPDRFVNEEAEFSVLGSDLRLAPFGSGRRSCPGKNLGLSTVTFWVAKLLQEFEWLPLDDGNGGVDLTEVLRLSCEMANPLTVQVRPRR
ncbi:hypothetical protein TSUD_360430 [Trifolium subterraneum]|uniref:Uncharacterized protein n=1 Tax=Trifolium subterraneum TaxID=3900 RepID=A0A2Z6MCH0_TRISU|nr:hypothetical protein TSUD_360430 [Trifolium subterraneum]